MRSSPNLAASVPNEPLVSVVVAAYGRPTILPFALRSAVAQTLEDIEIIVVGDAAGAETARAVADLADSRVRLIDLPFNYGEQSGPNNVGVARSRAPFIAFLNQDDIWFPDHLQVSLAWLEATNSDLVCTHGAIIGSSSPMDLESGSWRCDMSSPGRGGHYDPCVTLAPASTWLLRRELHKRLRGWRPALECRGESSRDFLVRAWRSRARLQIAPHLSLVIIQSGGRPASYLNTDRHEHEYFGAAMTQDPSALRARLLDRMTARKPLKRVRRLTNHVARLAARLGAHPRLLSLWRQRHRKGAHIKELRARRGLPPLLPLDADAGDLLLACALRNSNEIEPGVELGFGNGGEGFRVRAGGWSPPTTDGCEMARAEARLLLRLPPLQCSAVELRLLSAFTGQATAIDVCANGNHIACWRGTPGEQPRIRCATIPVPAGRGPVLLSLHARPEGLRRRLWPASAIGRPGFNVLAVSVGPT